MGIAEQVEQIARHCLLGQDELDGAGKPTVEVTYVNGIMHDFGFHKQRLESHRQEVSALIQRLPKQFDLNGIDGGWSFLNLPMDKDGHQWGEQIHAEALLCLAIGLGLGKILLAKPLWSALPGGVPYVGFNMGLK